MPGPEAQRNHRRTGNTVGLLSGLRLHLQIQRHLQFLSNIHIKTGLGNSRNGRRQLSFRAPDPISKF
jgi:hypothetical protein